MTYLQIFILILTVHFVADFALQTHDQAVNKGVGKSIFNKWLFYHVATYTFVWGLIFMVLPVHEEFQNGAGWLIFVLMIGIPHYITDWITSRIGKAFWNKNDVHNGFVVVGADQIIHYLCLLFVLSGMIKII